MKFLIVASCVLALAIALPYNAQQLGEWKHFKSTHNKEYSTEHEEETRMKIYFLNKEKVEEHNALFKQGKVSFKLSMNKFADMMPGEIRARYNGFNRTTVHKHFNPDSVFKPSQRNVAESIDWRTSGAVTDVKDQGQCGSCWAFSATGSLEGQNFLKNKKLVSISEQNLVDCSGAEGNDGCGGGLMDAAFQYIKDNAGIDTESSYPYEAMDGECRFNKKNIGAKDTGFVNVESGSEEALKQAIATIGPISVGIDASSFSFQLYGGGVYYEPDCSSQMLDHGVLAIGYGTENGQDYWLVKNSWGSSWGETGYIKMIRNKNNNCGIATSASYPVV